MYHKYFILIVKVQLEYDKRKVGMYKRQKAFTLVELMVVVAIIAILGTMSVGNFSSAIKRTRNSVRVSDMQAVAKAMEVCYDALSGTYSPITADADNTPIDSNTPSGSGGIFDSATNGCLNNNIRPSIKNILYHYSAQKTAPQKFVVCAQLEAVGGVEAVANANAVPSKSSLSGTRPTYNAETCKTSTDDASQCYYCIYNQQ